MTSVAGRYASLQKDMSGMVQISEIFIIWILIVIVWQISEILIIWINQTLNSDDSSWRI